MVQSPPRVTIAVLNYNYARFLRAAIDSALAQTHPDVEVVVVDDGSTDDSAAVIREYGDRIVAVLKSNAGQGSAVNAAFAASTGEIVCFLDADDALDPAMAASVAERFRAHPQASWVMFRLRMIDAGGEPLGRIRPHRTGVMPDGDLRRHLARYRCFHWQPTSGNAFAAAVLRQVLPMPEAHYRISADAYLAGVVPLCGSVRSTDAVLGSYRIHDASSFTSVAVDAQYFRSQIQRQVVGHEHAREVAARVGTDLPADVRAPRDAAFLGFRLASLLLGPREHPIVGDRRGTLVTQGVAASLANPELAWPNRLRRAAWFVACGCAPRRLARRLAADWAPDSPARRARRARRPAGTAG